MNMYETDDIDDVIESFITMIERDTKEKVFVLRILEHLDEKHRVIVVFENRDILVGYVTVENMDKGIGLRIQGNYI